jgi:hypothetical protein
MSELTLFIDVRGGDDLDLQDFLRSHGVSASPNYGIFNGPMPDVSEMLKHPAPYLMVYGGYKVLVAAIQAYASTKKKRFIISRLKTGVKIDATNYSVEEIRQLNLDSLDYVKLEAAKKKADDD